jgi:hypothetical protein
MLQVLKFTVNLWALWVNLWAMFQTPKYIISHASIVLNVITLCLLHILNVTLCLEYQFLFSFQFVHRI